MASYDDEEVMSGSSPVAIALAAGTLALVIGAIGYLPFVARGAQFERPWIALALTGVGAAASYLAWSHRCRGPAGTFGTLIDNGFYSAALLYAAASTHGGYGMGLAAAQGLMVLGFPARTYALTLPFALVMGSPLVVVLVLSEPSTTVAVIFIATYLMALLLAYLTGRQRELLRQQAKLTQAVDAATQVADDSVQAALATTLLSLGHFLHELRNYQTAVRANLDFVATTAALDAAARDALEDALEAQNAEQDLVRETMKTLRDRSRPANSVFILHDVIDAAAAAAKDIKVVVTHFEQRFVLRGLPDHLNIVLSNLIRNAAQANAREVRLETRLDASGEAVRLLVHDDGPGVPEPQRDKLFRPFEGSTKADGTGLGLYLCRRYVELFGGTIELGDGPLGGAAFLLRLPGRLVDRTAEQPAMSSDQSARSA